MWWFAALHANLLMAGAAIGARCSADLPILDAGCGTGGFLARLAAELSRGAGDWTRSRPARPVRVRLPRALGRSARARSTTCRSPMALLPRSSAPTCLCHRRRRRASCAAAISPLPAPRRLADPQPAGLSLDAVAARCRGVAMSGAIPRRVFAACCSAVGFPSGLRLLLERRAVSADGALPASLLPAIVARPATSSCTLGRWRCFAAPRRRSKPRCCAVASDFPSAARFSPSLSKERRRRD